MRILAANSVRPLKGGGSGWGSRSNAQGSACGTEDDPHPIGVAPQGGAAPIDLPLSGGGAPAGRASTQFTTDLAASLVPFRRSMR